MGKYIIRFSTSRPNVGEHAVQATLGEKALLNGPNKPWISWTNPHLNSTIPGFKFFSLHMTCSFVEDTGARSVHYEQEVNECIDAFSKTLSNMMTSGCKIHLVAKDIQVTEKGWVILHTVPMALDHIGTNLDIMQALHNNLSKIAIKHGLTPDRFSSTTDFKFHVSIGKIDFARGCNATEIALAQSTMDADKTRILAALNRQFQSVDFDHLVFEHNDGHQVTHCGDVVIMAQQPPRNMLFGGPRPTSTFNLPDFTTIRSNEEKLHVISNVFAEVIENGTDADLLTVLKVAASKTNGTINVIPLCSGTELIEKFHARIIDSESKLDLANALLKSAQAVLELQTPLFSSGEHMVGALELANTVVQITAMPKQQVSAPSLRY